MPGLSHQDKITQGSKDATHLISDSFKSIVWHVVLAIVIGAIAWGFTSVLRWTVVQANHYLFHPFQVDVARAVILDGDVDLIQAKANSAATRSFLEHSRSAWVFLGIILAGSIIRGLLFCSKKWQMAEGDGATRTINYFLNSYNKPAADIINDRYSRPTFIEAIRRMVITALTLGAGGSGGLEGPVIPIGESIGSGICKRLRIKDQNTLRSMQMAGIAAAVCTLLNAPFASAIFAVEIAYAERIIYRTFLFSIFSVVVAYALNRQFFSTDSLFLMLPREHTYTVLEYLQVSFVAIFLSAPCGLGLKWFFGFLKRSTSGIPVVFRSPMGALMVAVIALGLWFWLGIEPGYVLGMGENTISDLLIGTGNPLLQVWWILLIIIIAKILSTGFTLMTGGSAGLLVPAMVLGGTMGAAVYHLFSYIPLLSQASPQIFIISGIASALVAVIEVPLASIALVVELFGAVYAPPVMLAVGVSHLLASYFRRFFHFNSE